MMNFRVMALSLVMITTTSYVTCYIDELSESKQLACDHSGDSVCTMQGDDCCLTEMGEVKSESCGIPLRRVDLGADWTDPPGISNLLAQGHPGCDPSSLGNICSGHDS